MPAPRRQLVRVAFALQKLPIPVNIVTGHLACGKTTLICSLLRRKPAGEHWAVLVNEFGALGIDAALIEGSSGRGCGDGITVKQLAGGCMCCTLAGPMAAGIAQLVRRAKPDRLLIEPSGLGHPAGLVDVLQGEHLRSSLQLQAILCLLDPTQVERAEWQANELIQGQLMVADVVVITKADVAAAAQLERAARACSDLFPPKLRVVTARRGDAPLDLLRMRRDASFQVDRTPEHALPPGPNAAQPSQRGASDEGGTAGRCQLAPGRPVRFHAAGSAGRELATCGWIFDSGDCFHQQRLLALLQELARHAERLKGIFRVGKGFVTSKSGPCGRIELEPVSYRRESRVEVIVRASAAARSDASSAQCRSTGSAAGEGAASIEGELTARGADSATGSSSRRASNQMQDAFARQDWGAVERALTECLLSGNA